MTVPGMKKIFSAVAMTAAVVTLTLASADVLASGKGKDNGKSKAKESSSHVVSSGKGNSQSNGKGNGHDHSNSGKGHQHDHPGYINGVGHHKHHDHDDDDDEDDGSCEAPDHDHDHDHDGKGKGHDNHKGKGHQHDHNGYINGIGHHKHHDHDDDDDDDCGGGDTGGGDNGGGDNGGGVVLPEGCFMAAGYSDNSVTFASALGSSRFGFITPQAFGAEVNSVLADADANVLGGVYSVVAPDLSYFLINTANNYAIRELRIFSGAPGSYALDAEYTYEWIGSEDLQIPGGEYELPLAISGESAETVIEAMICSTDSGNTGN